MTTYMAYVALGIVAGLAGIERKGFLQAMLSRPVALGAITGAVLGDVGTGLYVAAPLELLWLGAINMGAALPVHEAVGTAAAAGAAVLCMRALRDTPAGAEPAAAAAVAVLAVACCAPLASLGRRVDRALEQRNERLYARAEQALAAGDADAAARVNLVGLAGPFLLGFALAPLGAAIAAVVIERGISGAPSSVGPLAVAWIAFCGFACAAGARAMRGRRAPVAFFAALAFAAAALALRWTRGGVA